ncbi:hypothetical protein [Haliangium sp.]|uniref:hypothetical protein n=1 Tax=Haliangium sp. TaxID=2663208 RepID=UPI003D13FB9A
MKRCNRSPEWLGRVAEVVRQEALIDTRTSLRALAGLTRAEAPKAVLVGIGLCSQTRLGQALPIDVLGMLLPAERLRHAAGASTLVVLVADVHALANGFDPFAVERRAQHTVTTLLRLRQACGFERMTVIRASSFHRSGAYRDLLGQVAQRLPERQHPYAERQIADVAYLDRRYGGILKVGWVRDSQPRAGGRDERMFDAWTRACFGHEVGFVYCKPGRALADRGRKAAPYITVEPEVRICLRPDEDPVAKLALARGAASDETVRGVRRHLGRLAYAYQKYVAALEGPLEHRVRLMIAHAWAGARVGASAESASARFAGGFGS